MHQVETLTDGEVRGTRNRKTGLTGRLAGLASLASLLLLPSIATAQTLELERAESGHLTVSVDLENSGPYTFLIDTGANRTAIAQPVAEALGFHSAWDEYSDVQSLTMMFDAERFQLNRMQVGTLEPIALNSVVIPVHHSEAIVIAGLLGADAIPTDRYTLDFANARLELGTSSPSHADGTFDERHLPLGIAQMRGAMRDVRILIDSGSAQTLVNPQLARRLATRTNVARYTIYGVDRREEEEAQMAWVRNLEIGGVCVNSLHALESDLEIFSALGWDHVPAMVIGMDVLQHTQLNIDREAGVFELNPATDSVRCSGRDARPVADSAVMP
jgi:predicted aspartyl protease